MCLLRYIIVLRSENAEKENYHGKGKQHKASCKAKSVSSISQPLQLLHMDLFGPTSVRSLNHKIYCLVITDDFSRFSWVFFLRTKDETSGILKDFIRQIENQLNKKVKTIRCDNGTEFKNRDMIEFCGSKGIKREYSNARTPQQNGVAERKNRTLIEAARTMLADSFLPNTFWAEAVSTACYVLNRVLVTKPQNKTPYELITGKIPIISYIRPFGCHVTILNTIDHLGKFDGKSDEGFLVGYSLNSKAFRGKDQIGCPKEANHSAGTQDNIDAENSKMEAESAQDYFVLPIWSSYTSTVKCSEAKNKGENPNKSNEKLVDQEDQAFLKEIERLKSQEKEANDAAEALRKEFAQDTEDLLLQAGAARASSTNTVNTASTPVSTASPSGGLSYTDLTNSDQDDTQIHALEDSYDNPNDGIFTNASYDDEGAVADFINLETIMNVSPIPTSRIHSVHPSTQILGDPKSAVQTRSKVNKSSGAHAFVSYIQKQRRNNHKDFQHCLFACFLSQNEPKKISEALEDESWIDAMQEELLQFKIQKVWILVDLPHGKKAIGTKWVYRNKKDERGVVVRNKARLVAQGHRQEEGIDYDEVFAPVARIEAIRIFLAFASYMGFIVYQMDVKSAFLYGIIDEESGYRRGTIDKTLFIKKDKNDIMLVQVYVDDIIFGSTKRSWCDEFEALMKSRFQMSSMGELTFFLGLQVKQKEDGIFISQDKYVAEILKKFDFASVKTASTPIETQKPLVKDEEATDVDVHLYRSMIGSLMYLTASRPDIMFAVCACSRFQVTPKTSHLNAVKRIFRYLKGKPKLGLWYPRVSSFDLEAYSDSDYAGANLDRKSTTGGCQFLGRRLISWQCKKQTIVATSTTEAEYVAAANCCGQVLWIQNQMLDYGFNFMNTKIYIDNESTICIVKNPVFHSKTKHIEIRHHFIRDAYEKKLIQVLKIHTDDNVADLLTKAFDVSSVPKHLDHSDVFHGVIWVLVSHWEELKMGKHFSGKVTPLFASMLVQPTEDEGATSARPSEPQPTPSPPHPKDTGGNHGVLLNMSQAKAVSREKEKGVELKDVEETERPRPTSTRSLLTLKPLPKIDPKDKGKKKIEEEDESDTESEGIPKAEKKFKQLAKDEEMARKVQEDWEAEEEVKKLAEEEAIKTALSNEYDFIQARIEADRLLALRLQDEEREQFTVEERAKFLHDTIAAQRRFLAEQRAITIRNKPPTRTQVLNSPCFMVKSWLVQDQTVPGKDYSNLLIADSLLKTIWFINAPCYGNEALASPKANGICKELTIPEQTATGKGKSNPFMAGSLPKITKPT
ncbi:putative ribonuclease H-like domain-containing protein [Tanacetum coccineum]